MSTTVEPPSSDYVGLTGVPLDATSRPFQVSRVHDCRAPSSDYVSLAGVTLDATSSSTCRCYYVPLPLTSGPLPVLHGTLPVEAPSGQCAGCSCIWLDGDPSSMLYLASTLLCWSGGTWSMSAVVGLGEHVLVWGNMVHVCSCWSGGTWSMPAV
ncbi:hypothetical protein BKA83DRAFT_4121742 [Pisolithus microcarpus]|nr:hypothetical protein BKA83DRAFT_4121742 [Pisolithus microcarpus]